SINACTSWGARLLTRATRAAWYFAAAMLISGSRPLAEAVTRSTGTGSVLAGSAVFNASRRVLMASVSAGFRGPWLDPLEAVALYGWGEVAEGRLQKYFGSLKAWPMTRDPTGRPPAVTRLPAAWSGNSS